jgi:hypothetical protein
MKKLDLEKWKQDLDKELDLGTFKEMEEKRDRRKGEDTPDEDTEYKFCYPERE